MSPGEKKDAIREIERAIRSPLNISANARALRLLPLIRDVVTKAKTALRLKWSADKPGAAPLLARDRAELERAIAALEEEAWRVPDLKGESHA